VCGCITITGILISIFYYVFCCRCSGPLIKRVYTCNGLWFDGSAVRAEFQTYRLYRLWDFDIGPKKSACVVSSVLGNGLHINTLISRGRKTWAGDGWRVWGGGVAGKPWPELDFNVIFMCRSARGGRFRRWLQPGGRGLMHAPLPLDRSLVARPKRAQKPLARSPDTPPFAARIHAPPHAPN
jgi:hypothetical protein